METTPKFHVHAVDWRAQLRLNQRRSRVVVGLFILIYLCLGLLIDTYLNIGHYPDATIGQIWRALLTFQIIPYATLVTVGVAVFSLLITYKFYDKLMLMGTEYHEITPETAQSIQERQLYNVVEEMKVAAGLKFMPRVFIVEANYMNAFATGYSEKSALVAITRGLMEKLDREELQAVMAHELSHIRHLDIKLTMMASILTNIILMIVDFLFYQSLFSRQRDSENQNQLLWIIMILRYVLPIITLLLMLYLSRTREYMADTGCIELMRNNEPLARALLKIDCDHQQNREQYRDEYGQTAHEDVRRAAYLYDPVSSGIEPILSLSSIFSTHPPIAKRLEAIGIELDKQ